MYKAFKNFDTSMEDTLQKTLQTIKEIEESPATGSEDAHFPMALQKQRQTPGYLVQSHVQCIPIHYCSA